MNKKGRRAFLGPKKNTGDFIRKLCSFKHFLSFFMFIRCRTDKKLFLQLFWNFINVVCLDMALCNHV